MGSSRACTHLRSIIILPVNGSYIDYSILNLNCIDYYVFRIISHFMEILVSLTVVFHVIDLT